VSSALHAEWTKLRSVAGNAWLMIGAIAHAVALSGVAVAAEHYSPGGSPVDITRLSLVGIDLAQALIVILAVHAMCGEYSSGMIRITLTALPRRLTVLAAKAATVCLVALFAGAIAVLGCLLVGRLVLPSHGFTSVHGYALLSLAHTPTLRAAVGTVLYLALIALLSLGIAAAVRDSAAAVGLVLGLLYCFPIVAALVGDPRWQHRLERLGPMTAGLSVQATTDLRSLPIGPWTGLGVLAAWAGAALLLGGLLLIVRDA
jgi:ABC-2 type transport system permease protein